MKPDTVLTLLDPQTGLSFDFAGLEIPAEIPVGGEQLLAVHNLIGGGKQVDSMGRSDTPLEWFGMFIGEGADSRARYIDSLRVAGRALTLTWHQYNYTVIINSFSYRFQRFYRLPYFIRFEVVADNTSPVRGSPAMGFDAALQSDLLEAKANVAAADDPYLTDMMGQVDVATKTLSTMATATTAAISAVTTPILAALTYIARLTSSVGNIAGNASSLGGLTAGGNAFQYTSLSFIKTSNLLNLSGILGRMLKNTRSIPHA